jgi:hypothetical protein
VPNIQTPHELLKTGAATLIGSLGLVSDDKSLTIDANSVFSLIPDQDLSFNRFPAVLLTINGLKEEPGPSDTENFYSWFPVAIALFDRDLQRTTAREADYLAWRLALRQAFHERHGMVTLPSPYRCQWSEVKWGSILDHDPRAKEFIATSLTVRFLVSEPRLDPGLS